ncbi:helix-turn-helix domain-containing protein [Burkholderia pyrrocinia]|uniref:helix-turn-helix domain-containing protein n=1 Tax=Burkholderia pyrrocinia TaxID=60550 RepID=UPI00158B635E
MPPPSPKQHGDNSLAAQRAKVLAMLRRAPRSTYELRAQGVSHPSARVLELRVLGCEIESSRVVAVDSAGFLHAGVARYSLTFEPARLARHHIG